MTQVYEPAPPPPVKPRPSAGLAIASLVLGIVGVVLSFMPVINNLTAAGAFVGLVLGVVGVWKSTRIMSWTEVGLYPHRRTSHSN